MILAFGLDTSFPVFGLSKGGGLCPILPDFASFLTEDDLLEKAPLLSSSSSAAGAAAGGEEGEGGGERPEDEVEEGRVDKKGR